jgi:hypothetical protein
MPRIEHNLQEFLLGTKSRTKKTRNAPKQKLVSTYSTAYSLFFYFLCLLQDSRRCAQNQVLGKI